jgi:hypothetical protein
MIEESFAAMLEPSSDYRQTGLDHTLYLWLGPKYINFAPI